MFQVYFLKKNTKLKNKVNQELSTQTPLHKLYDLVRKINDF